MAGSFWAPGPPKLTFVESKSCQFLFILSMGQGGVFQKILTSPISLKSVFLGHPVFLQNLNEGFSKEVNGFFCSPATTRSVIKTVAICLLIVLIVLLKFDFFSRP